MTLFYQSNEIGFERTGEVVTVPKNDVARLMYYLDCVCVAIDCNNDPGIRRFTSYHHWANLSFEEQKALVVVCHTCRPDVLNGRVFFHDEALCGDYNNEFFTIHEVRNRLYAVESIIIAGQVREVNKIMTYKMQWMRTNYYEPMLRLSTRLSAPPARSRPALDYTPIIVRQPYIQQPYIQQPYIQQPSNKNKWICGIIVVIIIIIILGNVVRLL